MMPTGTVVMLARNAKFGFIHADGAPADVFFHQDDLDDTEFQQIEVGSRIEFDVIDARLPGKQKAVNIRLGSKK